MTEKPDLSFTNDERWIAERMEVWAPIETRLKDTFRKKKIQSIKNYFFTGLLDVDASLSDGALITYFPLKSEEGWNYVLQNLCKKDDVFERNFYSSITNAGIGITDLESTLRFFDYHHPARFTKTVKSKVPIGNDKKLVIVQVDPQRLMQLMCSSIRRFSKELLPFSPVLFRSNYFFTTLDQFQPDLSRNGEYAISMLESIMDQLQDPQWQETEFFIEFKKHLDAKRFDKIVQDVWDQKKVQS